MCNKFSCIYTKYVILTNYTENRESRENRYVREEVHRYRETGRQPGTRGGEERERGWGVQLLKQHLWSGKQGVSKGVRP